MEQIKPIKVALVCGYTSHKTRAHLNLKSNKGFYQLLLKFFRLPARVGEFRDTTPWIEHITDPMSQRQDVELHLIAPQIRLKGNVQHFVMDGIYYHYYATELSSLLRKINNFQIWRKLQTNGKRIKNIIDGIHPDIVVLSGAENPATSICAFFCQEYPLYIMCQTVYSDPTREAAGTYNKLIWDMERQILTHNRYIGVYSSLHYELVKKINPNAIVFDFQYPRKRLPDIPDVAKEVDFINFAFELSEAKGAQDCIKALAIVKKKYPNVKMDLTGGCSEATKQELLCLVSELNLKENVTFTPFFEVRDDMFQHMKSARFAVLPIKYDNISGTVMQAMRYGLPTVTNVRPGTLKVNESSECLLLANVGDVEMLAEKMLVLMDDPEKADILKKNGEEYMYNFEHAEDHAAEKIVRDFHAIIENFCKQTPIPLELICNNKSFQQ